MPQGGVVLRFTPPCGSYQQFISTLTPDLQAIARMRSPTPTHGFASCALSVQQVNDEWKITYVDCGPGG